MYTVHISCFQAPIPLERRHAVVPSSYFCTMNIFIKNMVCPRCISAVEQLLDKNGIAYSSVRLGEVTTTRDIPKTKLDKLAADLQATGFELLDDQKRKQIEKVKNVLIKTIQQGDIPEHFSLSKTISKALLKEYSQVSKLFTEVEGITIEQFFILQKVEKIKEWLVYDEYSMSDIAFRLGYSSVQHLSTQFKKITGMTPGSFKKMGIHLRKPLDGV